MLGAGAIGMLSTYLLRLAGLEVWTAAREPGNDPRSELVAASGARYVSTTEVALDALREEVGGFDLVVEAAGDAQVMADSLGLLRRSGVACLLGIDGAATHGRARRPGARRRRDPREPRALRQRQRAPPRTGSTAVAALDRARERWPEALETFVGLRVPLDRFAEAFAYRGVKATLVLV